MKALFLIGASSFVLANAAFAQTDSPTPQPAAPEAAAASGNNADIIVTARRRAENIQDVPISITAVSGEALTSRGVRDALDLQYQTPSLTVTTSGASRSSVAYSIRGQRAQEVQLLTDPAVGSYFAEVVMPRTFGFGTAFYDLQNVQVLKGVQGTLFGRNMTGGAVLVEPNHPSFDGYHAEATVQYGNYDMKDIYGMVNVPLIADTLAFRVSGKFRDRDGFTKDVSNGRDYDDQHYYAIRPSIELKVGRFTSYTVFDFLKQREHGTGAKLIGYALTDPKNGNPTVIAQQIGASPFFPVAAGAPPQDLIGIFNRNLALGKYRVDYGGVGTTILDGLSGLPFTQTKNWGITNKTTFTAGDVTFKNIFGYRKIRYYTHADLDGSGAALILPNQFSYTKDISEEFQMQGNPFGSRFDFTLGGFFFRESGTDGALQSTFPQLTAIGYASSIPALAGYFLTQPASAYVSSGIGEGLSRSYAFYAAGTYKISDTFKLSGGIRYNDDLRKAAVNPFVPNLTIPGLGTGFCLYNGFGVRPLNECREERTLKNNAVTWDATIQYEPSNNLTAYLSARKGYRAGGFGLRATDDFTFQPFQPEKVQEYEAGIKNVFEFAGGARLNTSLAAYYQDYTNVQKQNTVLSGQGIGTIVTNTAAQKNYGGEFEANLSLPGGLNANLFYSYIKNKITRGDNGTYAMQGVPHHQLGGGITYARSIDGVGDLAANVNATYRSSIPLDENDAIAIQKGYALVNARLGLSNISGTGFGVAVFASNITNQYYMQGVISLLSGGAVVNGVNPGGGPGFGAAVFGEPRTYGIEASFKF